MNWFTAIVVFILIWWTALFAVLPWGVQRDESVGTGAPLKPMLLKKVLWTTGVSIVLWCVVYVLIKADVIDFLSIARQWSEEDLRK